ncbi:MAG: chemotaxis protein CheA [bacterium]|nr:chemotaxis protein CheA [bacterium]
MNEIFRTVHSLKSESSLIGFNNFSTLSHTFEDLFQRIRSRELQVNEDIIDISYKVMDEYRSMFGQIRKKNTDSADINLTLGMIRTYLKKPVIPVVPEGRFEPEEIKLSDKEIARLSQRSFSSIFIIKIKLFDNVALKFARAYLIYSNLLTLGEVARSTVGFEKEESNERYGIFSLILLTNHKEKEIYDLIDVSEVERVSIQKVSLIEDKVKEMPEGGEEEITESIRVPVSRIESLMNLVGEITVNNNRMEKFYALLNDKEFVFLKNDKSTLLDIMAQFKRIISSLQDDVMKVRMVPIKTLFHKFPRLIKTLSHDLKKKVNLTITGEDTEVDKTVIEEIREPLTHIIKNAIGHGIESPEERVRKGKSAEGTIRISSYQSGNSIVVEIADDGQGMDAEKMREKIIRNRLVNKDKIGQLTERQILSFIFLPGFSTSDKVTRLSGRGVGMDVVKNNIQKINGTINIKTEKDKGTTMVIAIPITVAIINSLILFSGGVFFAIPLYFVQETLRIYEDEVQRVDEYDVIYLRKKLLSLLRLNEMFSLTPAVVEDSYASKLVFVKHKKGKNRLFVAVVNYGNKKIGLVVDKFISEQDIVIKPLSRHIQASQGLIGATILGDGNIAYILDPAKLISHFLKRNI